MNHVERFRAVMNFQPVDRRPRWEWAMWWDETIARWLTARLGGRSRRRESAPARKDQRGLTSAATKGFEIRLPHENEWEWAARWNKDTREADSRAYPWRGSTEDDDEALLMQRCNSAETDLGHTSAVGLFPKGEADCGALDLAGNVWEWCRNEYEDVAEARRVLRGGSWINNRDFARGVPQPQPSGLPALQCWGAFGASVPHLRMKLCSLWAALAAIPARSARKIWFRANFRENAGPRQDPGPEGRDVYRRGAETGQAPAERDEMLWTTGSGRQGHRAPTELARFWIHRGYKHHGPLGLPSARCVFPEICHESPILSGHHFAWKWGFVDFQ
jgi:hypothetical protein